MLSRSWFMVLVGLILSLSAGGEEAPRGVSRTPPPAYAEQLEQHLTSLDEARKLPAGPKGGAAEAGTETLVREIATFVDESGREVIVHHQIRAVLSAAGAKDLASDRYGFSASRERLHLVLARTIRADGTMLPVEEKAAFLKRSEDDDDAVYSDQEELRIVFPEVTPGALVESIVVREVFEPQVEGEFFHTQMWGAYDWARRLRLVVDVPEKIRTQLHWQGIGFTLPEPEQKASADGRTLLSWQADAMSAILREPGAPPIWQRGPFLRISSMADWAEIGNWYAGLLRERESASEAVRAKVAEWQGAAVTPAQVAAQLFEHVASDVRYTGLEFGQGRLQPRSPEDVLTTCYGDCKDKANLLRVLLREKGIESRLALIDTAHAGQIDRVIPTPGRFDHAILAVDLPGGKDPVFCDPTIEGASFGVLAPGDVDRDALLIGHDGQVEWKRTSWQSEGRQESTLDLELEPGGGFSGWVTIEVGGYTGASVGRLIEQKNREGARQVIRKYLPGMRGVQVIDYELQRRVCSDAPDQCRLRVYVVKSGATPGAEAANERAAFPIVGFLKIGAGPTAERQTPVVSSLVDSQLKGSFRLPKGWQVIDLPPPLVREAAGFKVRASWKANERERLLSFEGTFTGTRLLVAPNEHRALWAMQHDLVGWLDNPALIKRPALSVPAPIKAPIAGADESEEPKRWAPAPETLPRMLSAEGQKALIDARYPFDPNHIFEMDFKPWRTAFGQMKSFFPEDHLAQFEAGICLALCDLVDGEADGALARIHKTIDQHATFVDRTNRAAGQMMLAVALSVLEKPKEVISLARPVAEDPAVEPRVRQGAALLAGAALAEEAPDQAVPFLRQALEAVSLPDISLIPAATTAFSCLARLPVTQPADLQALWDHIKRRYTGQAATVREEMVSLPEAMLGEGQLEGAERLVPLLEAIAKEPETTDEMRETIDAAKKMVAAARTVAPLHERIAAWFQEHPWPDLEKVEKGDSVKTVSDCIDASSDHDELEIRLRYALRTVVKYGPQADLADNLHEAASVCEEWLNATQKPKKGAKVPKPPGDLEALETKLLQFWSEIPEDGEAAGNLALFRGEIVQRQKGEAAVVEYYHAIAAEERWPAETRAQAHQEVAGFLEKRKDYPGLLAEWKALETWPEVSWTAGCLVDAAYLCLQLNQRDEAWRRFELIAQRDAGLFEGFSKGLHSEAVELVKDRAAAEAWWTASAAWWPKWKALCDKIGLKAPADSAAESPWSYEELDLEELLGPGQGKNKAKDQAFLRNTVLRARWHRSGVDTAMKVLRELAPRQYPKQAAAFRSLAATLETASAAPGRQPAR